MSGGGLAGVRRVGIVGGGILGTAVGAAAVARNPGIEVVLLEKEADLAAHQTGRNSGVVHAGLYYEPGSLKARLCVEGVARLRERCADRGIAFQACGKVVVALEEREVGPLHRIFDRAVANGVPDVALVGPERLAELEPHAAGRLALHSPRTAIVDFPAVARSLADDIVAGGGQVRTGVAVTGVRQEAASVVVTTSTRSGSAGEERVDLLVNCAGLHADRVARLAGDTADPRIVPFRGEYLRLVPGRRHLCRGLIYPVPDPRYPFLGVHLTKRVDGEVLVGPNAVLALAREGYGWGTLSPRDLAGTLGYAGFWGLARRHWRTGVDEAVRSLATWRFVAAARRYVPELADGDVVPALAGVRAQALDRSGDLIDDFRVTTKGRVVSLRNAPSPAATSALAIAEHLLDQLE